MASDKDSSYDDEVKLDGARIRPTVTGGSTLASRSRSMKGSRGVGCFARERASVAEALEFMDFQPGAPIAGTRIDVAFIGSCTNGRLSDLREAARLVKGRRVASHVKALVVPGSQQVLKAAEAEGLDQVFSQAGFEWRHAAAPCAWP